MDLPAHQNETEFQGVDGVLHRPKPKAKKPKWRSRILGSLVQDEDGSWRKAPEAERGRGGIQEAVESYLDQTGRLYFRVPDLVYMLMAPSSHHIPIAWKKLLSSYLSDWPDLLIPRLVPGMDYPLLLALELKSAAGVLTKGQKALGTFVNLRVANSTDAAIATIDTFFEYQPSTRKTPVIQPENGVIHPENPVIQPEKRNPI